MHKPLAFSMSSNTLIRAPGAVYALRTFFTLPHHSIAHQRDGCPRGTTSTGRHPESILIQMVATAFCTGTRFGEDRIRSESVASHAANLPAHGKVRHYVQGPASSSTA